jgi:hypothetical protein
MNLEQQHILYEIDKLIASYREEIKLLTGKGRGCDIVIGKIIGAVDVRDIIRPRETVAATQEIQEYRREVCAKGIKKL